MTTTTTRRTILAALAAVSGCNPDALLEDDLEIGEEERGVYDPANPPTPVATDACDESTHAGATWSSTSSDHLVAYTLPGTAAESDVATILAAREAAYANIVSALGITTAPTVSIYLSPSRLAAQAHGKGYGSSYPGQDKVEVVYTGAANSFEVLRPGALLARTLEYHIDTANPKRIPMLSVGLAEYLDQSGRNLHSAYAENLQAGVETRVRVNSLESGDVSGKNVGRAGSLVKLLIDRYGMATFLDIFKATAVSASGGCTLRSATYGCINSAATLTAMFDGVLTAETGDSWNTVDAAWKTQVDARLAAIKLGVSSADRTQITNLVNLMDQAIITDDADLYRSTMEGFYCEWGGDANRADIAARTVATYGGATSTVLRIYVVGAANFTTARALVKRVDDHGALSIQNLSLEKFPAGWRVTYGPDWW